MADNTLNISSDDAAIFSASSGGGGDDMDDGEDPTGIGQSRAGGKVMFRARKTTQTPLRQVLASGQVPLGKVRLTPGANDIP